MSASSAARKLQDTLTGHVTLTLLTTRGPVELDSPRCPSLRVAYERHSGRPGDGTWVIEWQGGPTPDQMRGYVGRLADVITVGYEHPLRGVQFTYRRVVSDAQLALVLDQRIRDGAFDEAMLHVLAEQSGAARAHAEYAATDTDLRNLTPEQITEYGTLIGKLTSYDMNWLIPLLIARHQTAPSDVTKSRDTSPCARCGGPLHGRARPLARYCSPACRQAAYRTRNPVTKPRDTTCATCGKPVPAPADPHRAGRHATYCSHACRQTAYRRRHATAP